MRRIGGTCARWLVVFLAVAAPASAQVPQGLDVSHYQGQISWLSVAAAGYTFTYAKATEGTTYTDGTYPLNRTGANGVGIRVGAYHFARPAGTSDAGVAASAIAQADAFLAFAQPAAGDLLPVLDLEKTGSLSTTRLTAWTQAWLDEVAVRLGARPVVYASPNFWKTALGDTPVFAEAGDRLWIAHWTSAALPILPGAGWGGLGWTFWQWTDCTHVPGIPHCVDGDRYNGSSLGGATLPPFPAGVPVAAAAPSIVGTPQAGKLLAALPGSWRGGKPVSFGYQWQSCDAAGAGCGPIAGATGETYTPATLDAGHAIAVSVTATTSAGTALASSPPTLAVASSGAVPLAAPKATKLPGVLGTPQVGQTLSASTGTWTGSPTSFAYQWRRCAPGGICEAIEGAAGTSYVLTPGEIGSTVSFVVTATGKGGSRSATAASTAAVSPAPVPAPLAGSAPAEAGAAGAVASPDNALVASWQPGTFAAPATVTLAPSTSRLSLSGSVYSLETDAPAPLAWPLDVQYAAAPADAVPGFIPSTGGVWQPLAELDTPTLPDGQDAGVFRDGAGALHVMTRLPGRVALFAPGKWGDPRFTATARPNVTLVENVVTAPRPDGTVLLRARFTLDTQAHLYASIVTPGGGRSVLLKQGSRLGWWLQGAPTKTFQSLQLRPGALPIRIRIPAGQLRADGAYVLRIAAIDPYGRHGQLLARFTPAG